MTTWLAVLLLSIGTPHAPHTHHHRPAGTVRCYSMRIVHGHARPVCTGRTRHHG